MAQFFGPRPVATLLMLFTCCPAFAQGGLDAWRTAGARPVLAAMSADGVLDGKEREIAGRLSRGIEETVTVHLPGSGEMTVTPHPDDAELLAVVQSDAIDLNELWDKDVRVFTQLAMLSDATYQRLRRYAASRFYDFPARAPQWDMSLKEMLEDWYRWKNINMKAFMSETEMATLARLCYEAMEMVAGLEQTDISPGSYEWLRCEFDRDAAC